MVTSSVYEWASNSFRVINLIWYGNKNLESFFGLFFKNSEKHKVEISKKTYTFFYSIKEVYFYVKKVLNLYLYKYVKNSFKYIFTFLIT